MHPVQEISAKRRKLDNGEAKKSQEYDSHNDNGDDIFDDYETVATLPLPPKPNSQSAADIPSSPPVHVTQATQIIQNPSLGLEISGQEPSIVQVIGSSPARSKISASVSPSPAASKHFAGGRLADSLAPAGTVFRPPIGVSKAPPGPAAAVVDISDDEDVFQSASSDEESQAGRSADIKPSTFIQSSQRSFGSASAKPGIRFGEIMTKSFYKPLEKGEDAKPHGSTLSGSVYDQRNRDEKQTTSRVATTSKRSVDTMANAYGGAIRPFKQTKQQSPAKALPAVDLDINDIEDYQLQAKIKRIRQILPQYGVHACKTALEKKRYNFDDAMAFLADQEDHPISIDLLSSDGEDPLSSRAASNRAPAKQRIKAPTQKIQEKWTNTQNNIKNNPPSSLAVNSPPIKADPKPRRRLVNGRKQPSSPVIIPSKQASPEASPRASTPASNDSDSGLGTEPDDDELDTKVLKFFNTCSIPELVDIAAIRDEVASVILSQKPFRSLDEVRQISSDIPSKSKRKSTRKPIGDKIVDKCLEMWTGYEAVDDLVRKCEELGQPVREEMKKWGVDMFGAANAGELEFVDFDSMTNLTRDSGIGTPMSRSGSDEDCDGEIKCHSNREKYQGFFPQPSIMDGDIKLKDYQVVGINWLSLLFDRELSCILADDMGLGKTCQVVAFLAHLLEKGVKGPHLVVVPGSTLENWLREFSIFCPKLHVMPYYAGQSERPGIQTQILESLDTLNVIVTTYTLAKTKEDNKFLRKLKPVVCVYDEGHILKNSKSAGYEALMRIQAQFRLLLTGTPLQNNLRELASLLGFILPSVFKEHSEDLEAIFSHKAKTTDDSHAALLSSQRITRAKSMMAPFVLRRKKHQVLRHLPSKSRRVEYCELSESQNELYQSHKMKALRVVAARAAGQKTGNETSNVMMALRKASIHPLLFRRLYDDSTIAKMSKACLKEEQYQDSNEQFVYEDMEVMTDMELHRFCEANPLTMAPFLLQNEPWMESGKVSKLALLLKKFKENGDRVLVFSQFVMVIDILEAVMETLNMRFFRLDGQTAIEERQDMIDQFYKEEDITVFLLSTRAGGAGIK